MAKAKFYIDGTVLTSRQYQVLERLHRGSDLDQIALAFNCGLANVYQLLAKIKAGTRLRTSAQVLSWWRQHRGEKAIL